MSQRKTFVQRQPFSGPLARQLIAEVNEEYLKVDPKPGKDGLYVPDDVDRIKTVTESENPSENAIQFFVAFFDSEDSKDAVGCIAIKPRQPGLENLPADVKIAELKRLYVRAAYRSRGVAQKLLETAENEARDGLGVELLVLETGIRQRAAIRLYERNGWKKRATFGPYVGDGVEDGGVSVCYEKYLKR